MRILILGCGDLGSRLGRLLNDDGHVVFGARRRIDELPTEITGIPWDFDDPKAHDGLPVDVDIVCWTGAPGGRGADEERYRQVYVDAPVGGLRSILRRGGRPTRVVLASSTSVYGVDDGSTVDEATAAQPEGFRGRVILEGEEAVRSLGIPTTALRCGGLYGPGRDYLIRSVREGSATLSEHPPGPWTNRIHIDDAARAMRFLIDAADPPDHVLGVDPNASRRDEVLSWIAAELGLPIARGGATPSRGGHKRVDPKWLRSSGFEWLYPDFRSGYAAMLAE